jgi:catechol-2,3-dioxygenase
MKRVTGIGGIFFSAKNAPELRSWYQRHLGVDVQARGGAVFNCYDGKSALNYG